MRCKISIEGLDEITEGQQLEFEIEKDFDDPTDGQKGLTMDDSKKTLLRFSEGLLNSNAVFSFVSASLPSCGGNTSDQGLFHTPHSHRFWFGDRARPKAVTMSALRPGV